MKLSVSRAFGQKAELIDDDGNIYNVDVSDVKIDDNNVCVDNEILSESLETYSDDDYEVYN